LLPAVSAVPLSTFQNPLTYLGSFTLFFLHTLCLLRSGVLFLFEQMPINLNS
jgi:hypothetical protein